jgi:hypothetical protein
MRKAPSSGPILPFSHLRVEFLVRRDSLRARLMWDKFACLVRIGTTSASEGTMHNPIAVLPLGWAWCSVEATQIGRVWQSPEPQQDMCYFSVDASWNQTPRWTDKTVLLYIIYPILCNPVSHFHSFFSSLSLRHWPRNLLDVKLIDKESKNSVLVWLEGMEQPKTHYEVIVIESL